MIKSNLPTFKTGFGHVSLVGPGGKLSPVNFENNTMVSGLQSLIALYCGDATKGQAKYIEIGMGTTPVNSSNLPGDTVPKARGTVTATPSGLNFVFDASVSGSGAETHSDTATTGSTTTTIELNTTSNVYQAGGLIRVNDPGNGINNEDVNVLSFASDQIVLDPSTPLSSAPGAGATVSELITEVMIYGDDTATATEGSGVLYARALLSTPQTIPFEFGMDIEWQGGFNSP